MLSSVQTYCYIPVPFQRPEETFNLWLRFTLAVCWRQNTLFRNNHRVHLPAMHIHFTQHNWSLAYSTIHSSFPNSLQKTHYFFPHHTGWTQLTFPDILKPSGMVFSTRFLNATERYCYLPQAHHPASKFGYSWKYGGYGFQAFFLETCAIQGGGGGDLEVLEQKCSFAIMHYLPTMRDWWL
jgi:hypothetical protein